MLKKILGIVKKIGLGIVIFIALYFIIGYCCSQIVIPAEEGTHKEVAIYIQTNGMHTDIVVPVHSQVIDWDTKIPYSNNISKDTVYNYLALGWGDKGFFLDMPTWDDLTFGLAFRAAFWINTTAMHATYYKEMIEDQDCCKIMISELQYQNLVKFITNKFKKDSESNFINIKTDAAYGLTDAFYEAEGHYSIFYSCNTWANYALKACGQKHCLWTFFKSPIFSIYNSNN